MSTIAAQKSQNSLKLGSLPDTHLPDGGHGKVQLHENGAKGEQAGGCAQDVGVRGPVGGWDVAGNLVGPGRVADHRLFGCHQAACRRRCVLKGRCRAVAPPYGTEQIRLAVQVLAASIQRCTPPPQLFGEGGWGGLVRSIGYLRPGSSQLRSVRGPPMAFQPCSHA